jgi:MscS family membrane protein
MAGNSIRGFRMRWLLCCLALLCYSHIGWSQETAGQDTSMRELIEKEQAVEEFIEKQQNTDRGDIVAESTPLSSMLAVREALRERDYTKAGQYLDMRYLPEELSGHTPEELVQELALVWNQQNIIDISALSDDPRGNMEDGLPSYRDLVGTVTISSGEIPILLQRVPDGEGGRVWKFSNATVARIPEMWEELGFSPVALYLREILPEFRFMGMENFQVLATVLFFLFAWPLAALISNLLLRIALKIPNHFPKGITRFFRRPFRFFLFILIARLLVNQMGLSLSARILLESSGVDYIAYTVLLLGLISLFRDYQIRKMEHQGNVQYVALMKPFTTILQVVVIIVIALFWAERAGYDMSTILAGLGVGSLAVALAAQKTLENVIGAITLYTARPVKAGDFCRFGQTVGTVEEIGLRSTIIRTPDRTRVFIPNSVFSSVEVENYSSRDRIRYFRQLQLQMTTADQLRVILAELRKMFYSHPKVLQDSVSVRLEKVEQALALVRLEAGASTRDFQEYLTVAEDINLRIIELVHNVGAAFSGPGQVLQLRKFKQASDEETARVEAVLREWREQDRQPFPDYSAEEIKQFRGTIDFP